MVQVGLKYTPQSGQSPTPGNNMRNPSYFVKLCTHVQSDLAQDSLDWDSYIDLIILLYYLHICGVIHKFLEAYLF